MTTTAAHRCLVLGSPWKGVYCTHIESARHYGKHHHTTYGFGLLEQGAHVSASGRGKVEAFAGDVITVNPGEVHDGRPLGSPLRRWRIVYLDPSAMTSITGGPDAAAVRDVEITQPVIKDTRLSRALHRLFARLEDWSTRRCPNSAEVLACEESLVEVCGLLVDCHATAAPMRDVPAGVTQVRDRLADDPLNPPTLAELASIAGLSKYQVLRRFQKVYGVPPHAWLLQQRAERARRLIRDGSSLSHAAASAGFADQSHMTRVFVRQFGFTPGAWRRAAASIVPS
jgi:AraC-like DNA-binding protein